MSKNERITKLREAMKASQIDFYYVPSNDQHFNEYVPEIWQRRAWISNFTGSAGDALVGQQEAYLWTDPRYFLQANIELDSNYYQLMKQQQGMAPIDQWFKVNARNKKVGVDPKLISIAQVKKWQSALQEVKSTLIPIEKNLIDEIWKEKPIFKEDFIQILPNELTGQTAKDKIKAVRNILQERNIDAHVITVLDAIAWLYNIRGNDIAFNPLVISYALLTKDKAFLFVDANKVKSEDKAYFQQQGVEIMPYPSFAETLQHLTGKVLVDPSTGSWWIQQQLLKAELVLEMSPITLLKACKNSVEAKGMHEAHRKDAVALCKFFHWLESNWREQTEISAAEKLLTFRAEDPSFRGLSFETISAFGEHGAIVHYRVNNQSNASINDKHLYLVDSGGQYWEGTTDVTRTVHLGEPTEIEKKHYTLVLKGHLALRNSIFPQGTCGEHLNAFARAPLWKEGLDFGHGTGHGVGCYLCVHEGPQRISAGITAVPLLPGMMVSNEPGFYVEGKYGIRIENICQVIDSKYKGFFTFEDLTLFPYARKLIDTKLLSNEEIQQINDYHQLVWDSLSTDLKGDVREWLKAQVQPLRIGD